LLLDAGNALWSRQVLAQQTNGKVIIEGMNLLGYDAMLLGDLDLQLGAEVIRQRIAEAKFPVLSANVLLASNHELLARPYVVVEKGGRKVGIIGLTSDFGQLTLTPAGEQYVLLKAEDELRKYASELAQQTDILIVLSNMGYDEDTRLSSAVPGIDLIVGGRSRLRLEQGWRNEGSGTVVVQAGEEGKCIGRCELHLDSAGSVTGHSCQLVDLGADFADDAELRAFLDGYPKP
jgi:2',3'-cyclic-nucleotide 2'-phosphodiesterase (5'-nucleotidase family)